MTGELAFAVSAPLTYADKNVHREQEGLDVHVRRQQAPFT